MNKRRPSRLRLNVGFLLESAPGTRRKMEIDFPTIQVGDDVTLSPLQGEFETIRTSGGVYVSGLLESALNVDCVRCLEEMSQSIPIELDALFSYSPSTTPEGEYPVDEAGFIDLSPLVRELRLLRIPMQPICRPDCQGLCMECGQNLNVADCGCEADAIDPRLAGLRELLE
jgi:uncharacterized protein